MFGEVRLPERPTDVNGERRAWFPPLRSSEMEREVSENFEGLKLRRRLSREALPTL